MSIDLTNPIFHDEDAAREHLEAQRWPDGPICPHCESRSVTKLEGKAHRTGLYQCKRKSCREQFSVTVGTVMERSHIPLPKWVLAIQLMAASKKGMSAKQIERMLGISYRSAWFMMHRIREAMTPALKTEGPLGGKGTVVESDETYVGGRAKNAKKGKPTPKKHFATSG
jgi:transposase-like protein